MNLVSKKALWAGRIISVLPALMLIFSASLKLIKHPEAFKGFDHLGYPARLMIPLGVLELSCAIIYLIPRTAVLGAILVTGYMGGAITTHLRIGEPFIIQALLGMLVWLGIYLRDRRVRELIPVRS
jgi:hypothetical protein